MSRDRESEMNATFESGRTPAISVRGLVKVYGSGEDAVRAVDGVSFDVEQGTVVGILGPNGAGKTTTIKSILGLIVPTSGRIRVDGVDVLDDTRAAYERMGAMLEGTRNTYWRLTVRENVEIFSVLGDNDYRDRTEEIDALLDRFNLAEKEDTVVRQLSRGQKQKVSLACTLARDSDVVFLDEPTLGLDVESTAELRAKLRGLADSDGRTVVLSSHDLDVIQAVCDRVIIVNDGRVVADDSVENLLGRFDSPTFEVGVDGKLERAVHERLAATFDLTVLERAPNATTIAVQASADRIYDLVGILEDHEVQIESFTEREPDLEDVFVRITGEGREQSAAAPDGGGP